MASAWALIIDHGDVLLTQRTAATSRPNQWCLPGGGVKLGESPEDACVREVKEETGLLVEIEKQLGQVDDSIYFQCRLSSSRDDLRVQKKECQSADWTQPDKILALGKIMDLGRLIPLFRLAELPSPPIPNGLNIRSIE